MLYILIGKESCQKLLSVNDPTKLYSLRIKSINSIYGKCFPLIKVKWCKGNSVYRPCLTSFLLKCCKRKVNNINSCYYLKPLLLKLNAKAYKNKCSHLLKISERTYYHEKNIYIYTKSNLSKTWKLIKQVLSKGNINN